MSRQANKRESLAEEFEGREEAAINPSELPRRAPMPRARARLHKRNIYTVVAGLSLVLGYATVNGLSGPEQSDPDALKNLRPATPDELVKNLPGDYSLIKRPKIGPPLQGDLGEVQLKEQERIDPYADLNKYLEALRLERLKKAVAARESEITFASLRTLPPQISKRESEGGELRGAALDVATRENALRGISTGAAPGGGFAAGLNGNSRDEDNRQDDKLAFLQAKRDGEELLESQLQLPRSRYELMAGTLIPALLLSGINSDLPGEILAQVSENVFDTAIGKYLLIPQGTKLLGEYDSKISYGQERVLVVWKRLMFPDGSSINLEGMPGVDLSGYAGLHDQVNNHYGRLVTAAIFSSFLGATAQVAHGSSRVDQNFSELAVQGFADNLNQAGQQITRKNLQIQPTLEIRPGWRVNVFVTKDIRLRPYKM